METRFSTHQMAHQALFSGDFETALRVAGPMLESDPGDLTAWRITAWALYNLGETEVAITNLKSLALSLAQDRRPILSLAHIKELEHLGENVDELITKLASMYGADSDRLVEADLAPPPLPSAINVEPWPGDQSREAIVQLAKEAMAVSWGQALTATRPDELPFVPLLSVLSIEDFVPLVKILKREVYRTDDAILEQGNRGDAMYIIAEGGVRAVHRDGQGRETTLIELGPGAFFGEMALVSNAPRAASIIALKPTVVLRANKADLESLAASAPEIGNTLVAFCHARMLTNLIRVSPVLAPVPISKRAEVIARFSTDFRHAGHIAIEEGKPGPGLFLIVSGQMQVLKSDKGGQTIVAHLGPGDLFGEISLIMRKPSTATVVATEDTALLFLSAEQFHEATRDFPELLKGAFDIALTREEKNNSILASAAAATDELLLL